MQIKRSGRGGQEACISVKVSKNSPKSSTAYLNDDKFPTEHCEVMKPNKFLRLLLKALTHVDRLNTGLDSC
jgi:hypothetical protein